MAEVISRPSHPGTEFEPQGLKLQAAAKYLGISQITVRRLVRRGELRPVRRVRHLLFARASLDAFLTSGDK